MEKEKFTQEIEITMEGDFAVATRVKGDYSVEKSIQLLIYMKGKGYKFIGVSYVSAYFVKEEKK